MPSGGEGEHMKLFDTKLAPPFLKMLNIINMGIVKHVFFLKKGTTPLSVSLYLSSFTLLERWGLTVWLEENFSYNEEVVPFVKVRLDGFPVFPGPLGNFVTS